MSSGLWWSSWRLWWREGTKKKTKKKTLPFAFGFADLKLARFTSVTISTTNWAYRSVTLRGGKYKANISRSQTQGNLSEGLFSGKRETRRWSNRWNDRRRPWSMLPTWYDSSPWADVFINKVFSTLPSSDGRKISLKDAFPLGGIT